MPAPTCRRPGKGGGGEALLPGPRHQALGEFKGRRSQVGETNPNLGQGQFQMLHKPGQPHVHGQWDQERGLYPKPAPGELEGK